jgi:hypothetical protein
MDLPPIWVVFVDIKKAGFGKQRFELDLLFSLRLIVR